MTKLQTLLIELNLNINLFIFIEKGPKCLLAVSDLYLRIITIEEEINGVKCAESFSATVKMGKCAMWCIVL